LDDNDEENDMGANIDSDNGDEVLEVSPTPGNAKRKAHIILEKPNKKPKSTTAQSFVSSRQARITIEQVMEHVIACGLALGVMSILWQVSCL